MDGLQAKRLKTSVSAESDRDNPDLCIICQIDTGQKLTSSENGKYLFYKKANSEENPFNKQICRVFSDDGSGNMTFLDFLDMFSVFSENAPRDIKTVYAFRIYDFDGDEVLSKEDLAKTVTALTKGELTDEEVKFVVNKVMEEVDLDDDGSLSYIEFEHVISRASGFQKTFHLRI